MPNQFGRPIADIARNTLTASPGTSAMSPTPNYAEVDESVAADGDYILGATALHGVGLQVQGLLDPGIHTGHIIRTRAARSVTGSGTVHHWVELWEDDGDGTYTLRADFGSTSVLLTDSFADYTWTVSGTDAGNITPAGYTRGLIVAVIVQINTAGREGRVSWVELELPQAQAVNWFASDSFAFSGTAKASKTVRPTLADTLNYSQSGPAVVDGQRLVDLGEQWTIERTGVSRDRKSAIIVGRTR